jgi:hypothetical protein
VTRLELTLAGVILVLLGIGGFALYERHEGAKSIEKKDAVLVAQQADRVKRDEMAATSSIAKEEVQHDVQVTAPVIPSPALECVRVVPTYPRAVLPAAAAAGPSDGTAHVPAATGARFDPSAAVKKVGERADADMKELQDYVASVCLAAPPQKP